jgi:hypothetical protein
VGENGADKDELPHVSLDRAARKTQRNIDLHIDVLGLRVCFRMADLRRDSQPHRHL